MKKHETGFTRDESRNMRVTNATPATLTATSFPACEQLIRQCEESLQELRERDLLRTLTTIEEIAGCRVRIDGTWKVSWCSNDYLGLSVHPRVVQAACEAAKRWGIGARASRLLAGSTALHAQLEARLASFFGTESAIVFPSGYLTNLGTLATLLGPGDVVVVDRLAHASLIDACRASRATLRVFHHNEADHAASILMKYPEARRRLLVTEGVFSMDGDAAPLSALSEVARTHDALLYLDDAHGAFTVGSTGRGSPEAAGVSHQAMLYMGTLGKALGCQGGFVAGPASLITLLQNRARTFIYATALAVPVIAAAVEALRVIEEEPAIRTRLAENAQLLHARLSSPADLGAGRGKRNRLHRDRAPSHIVPVIVGSAPRARDLSSRLWQRGLWAPAIRPPTVPEGTARLRLSLSALHEADQIEELAQSLRDALAAQSSS